MIWLPSQLVERLLAIGRSAIIEIHKTGNDNTAADLLAEILDHIKGESIGQGVDPASFEIVQVPSGSENSSCMRMIVRSGTRLQAVARFSKTEGLASENDVAIVDLATHKETSFQSPRVARLTNELRDTLFEILREVHPIQDGNTRH